MTPPPTVVRMSRLLLVRHGQSEWNATGRWQGQEDPPLTELGEQQAHHAALALGVVDGVFSSTLERARVTAEVISSSLGVGPVVVLEELRERHAGEWQGLTRPEIDDLYPGYLAEGRRPDGWEADDDLAARAWAALGAIASTLAGGEAVVVTHGGVIYQVERDLGAPFERIANLGGRWIESGEGGFVLGDRLELLEGAEITIPDQI